MEVSKIVFKKKKYHFCAGKNYLSQHSALGLIYITEVQIHKAVKHCNRTHFNWNDTSAFSYLATTIHPFSQHT